jgi:hypothetical protein
MPGANRYALPKVNAGQSKANAFWSFSMYNPQQRLVRSPIKRPVLPECNQMKGISGGSLDSCV